MAYTERGVLMVDSVPDSADPPALPLRGDHVRMSGITYQGPREHDDELLARLPGPLRSLLTQINGFILMGGALHVRGACKLPAWHALEEVWTGISPTAAYWNPTIIKEDTRLKAMGTDITHYVFDNSGKPRGDIRIQLWYRRAFYDLMKQKGWKTPDILLKEAVLVF